MMSPIHLRVLLDETREKIASLLKYQNWENFCFNRGALDVLNEICTNLGNKKDLPSERALDLLISVNRVRQSGNYFAHNTQPEEIQKAILFSSFQQDLLKELYLFMYGTSIQ